MPVMSRSVAEAVVIIQSFIVGLLALSFLLASRALLRENINYKYKTLPIPTLK
jgi:hypothetical protein